MLTHLAVRNFKRFQEVELELGANVVLVGPNNSGKTTALQALALWHIQRDQVRKALTSIGFEQYQLAEQCGWMLYLEGSNDLDILRALAVKLNHPAARYLERPFVKYVSTNLPQIARDHFFGLREAKPDLIGIAIFDRLDKPLRSGDALCELMWHKREIENYLCQEAALLRFARGPAPHDLFASQREQAMRDAIAEVSAAGLLPEVGPTEHYGQATLP